MGAIVVGIDGSANARRALAVAAAEARARGARLRVITTWMVPLFEGMPMPIVGGFPVDYGRPYEEICAAVESSSRELVEREVAEVLGADPGIEIEPLALEGAPATVLIDASREADLLVVGSRGRGGFKGLLLGSVSQQCVHHAACPVLVVPPEKAERA